jgi:malonyl-CoA O-methyltransferase
MLTLETKYRIAKSFGSASRSYDISARLQRYSGKHLMQWLPNRSNLTVLDLGSGTGFFTDILASRYQQVLGLDISTQMLRFAKSNRHKSIQWLEGDLYQLPFLNNSLDVVYCNLVIQWCDPLEPAIAEIMRVLKPGGLFIFSTLVEGTLSELKTAWAMVDNDKHVIDFKTVLQLKSALKHQNAQLLDAKQDTIVLEYEDVLHLVRELKGLGANQVPTKRKKGLAGKESWQKMLSAYQQFVTADRIYPATYELFSGIVVKLND